MTTAHPPCHVDGCAQRAVWRPQIVVPRRDRGEGVYTFEVSCCYCNAHRDRPNVDEFVTWNFREHFALVLPDLEQFDLDAATIRLIPISESFFKIREENNHEQ